MPVNDALLHNWFYGNHAVRVAAAIAFGFLLGSIPVGPVARWLFADLNERWQRAAAMAVLPVDALKGFVPTVIALHGGGQAVGLSAALAVTLGHYYCPWRRFHGGRQIDVLAGAVFAISPFSAVIFVTFWIVTAIASESVTTGTAFAAALLFFPLWFFQGAAAALFGIAAGTALALRLRGQRQLLKGLEIENFDRPAAAAGDQATLL